MKKQPKVTSMAAKAIHHGEGFDPGMNVGFRTEAERKLAAEKVVAHVVMRWASGLITPPVVVNKNNVCCRGERTVPTINIVESALIGNCWDRITIEDGVVRITSPDLAEIREVIADVLRNSGLSQEDLKSLEEDVVTRCSKFVEMILVRHFELIRRVARILLKSGYLDQHWFAVKMRRETVLPTVERKCCCCHPAGT